MEKKEQTIAETTDENISLKSKLRKLRKENKKAGVLAERLRQSLNAAEEFGQTQVHLYEKEKKQARKKINAARQQLNQAQRQHEQEQARLNEQLEQLKLSLEEVSQANKDQSQVRNKLSRQVGALKKKAETLTSQSRKMSGYLDDNRQTLQYLREAHKKQLGDVNREMSQLKRSHDVSERTMQADHELLQRSEIQLRQQLIEKSDDLQQAEEQIKAVTAELDSASHRQDELLAGWQQLGELDQLFIDGTEPEHAGQPGHAATITANVARSYPQIPVLLSRLQNSITSGDVLPLNIRLVPGATQLGSPTPDPQPMEISSTVHFEPEDYDQFSPSPDRGSIASQRSVSVQSPGPVLVQPDETEDAEAPDSRMETNEPQPSYLSGYRRVRITADFLESELEETSIPVVNPMDEENEAEAVMVLSPVPVRSPLRVVDHALPERDTRAVLIPRKTVRPSELPELFGELTHEDRQMIVHIRTYLNSPRVRHTHAELAEFLKSRIETPPLWEEVKVRHRMEMTTKLAEYALYRLGIEDVDILKSTTLSILDEQTDQYFYVVAQYFLKRHQRMSCDVSKITIDMSAEGINIPQSDIFSAELEHWTGGHGHFFIWYFTPEDLTSSPGKIGHTLKMMNPEFHEYSELTKEYVRRKMEISSTSCPSQVSLYDTPESKARMHRITNQMNQAKVLPPRFMGGALLGAEQWGIEALLRVLSASEYTVMDGRQKSRQFAVTALRGAVSKPEAFKTRLRVLVENNQLGLSDVKFTKHAKWRLPTIPGTRVGLRDTNTAQILFSYLYHHGFGNIHYSLIQGTLGEMQRLVDIPVQAHLKTLYRQLMTVRFNRCSNDNQLLKNLRRDDMVTAVDDGQFKGLSFKRVPKAHLPRYRELLPQVEFSDIAITADSDTKPRVQVEVKATSRKLSAPGSTSKAGRNRRRH